MTTRRRVVLVMMGLTLLAVAGCSKSSPSLSPTSPSPLAAPPVPAGSSGATVNGVVDGASGTLTTPSATLSVMTSGMSVSVVGTDITATIDGVGRFALAGIPAGDIQLRFTGPGVDAMLTLTGVQDREQIQITVSVAGSHAALEHEHRVDASNKVEIEGRISSVNSADRTVQVNSTMVAVPADAIIRHGSISLQLSDLQIGQRVHIRGIKDGAAVRAVQIEVQNRQEEPGNQVELRGTVSAVSGCPTPTLTVNGTIVTTTPTTQFKGGTCADIKVGTKLEVKGAKQSSGGVLASKIEIEEVEKEVEVKGTVSAVSGCPTPTLTVNGTMVTTTPTTQFKGGTCTDIKVGTKVEVKGTKQSSGAVLASKIEIKK